MHNKRGFSALILILLIGAIVVFCGVAVYTKIDSSSQNSEVTSQEVADEDATPITETDSIEDITEDLDNTSFDELDVTIEQVNASLK